MENLLVARNPIGSAVRQRVPQLALSEMEKAIDRPVYESHEALSGADPVTTSRA